MTKLVYDTGIYAPPEIWARLRVDPAFCELLRLARVVNSLSLAYGPLIAPIEDQSPRARRERTSAFAYVAALLHEGLHTAQSLGAHFRQLPAYRTGIATLLGDPDVQALRSELLDRIRDELVFHFDRDSIAEGLTRFPDGEVLVGTTSDASHGQIYYDIGDDVLAGYLFGDAESQQAFLERFGAFMERTIELFNRFVSASHSLMGAALQQMGCVQRPFARPMVPLE
jgi:hypothetical protein